MKGFAALSFVALVAFGLGWAMADRSERSPSEDEAPIAVGSALRDALATGNRLDRLYHLTDLLRRLDAQHFDEVVAVYDGGVDHSRVVGDALLQDLP